MECVHCGTYFMARVPFINSVIDSCSGNLKVVVVVARTRNTLHSSSSEFTV